MTTAIPQIAEVDTLRAYAYSYPHKSSYRALTPPVSIAKAWQGEAVSQLSLYVHLPFCEMRCGFCNLFTQSQPKANFVNEYLAALTRQMSVVRQCVPKAQFSQFAIGGGTPTLLSAHQLAQLFYNVERTFEFSVARVPTSVETSPATATVERLRVLKQFGVQRISIGVQAFGEPDARSLGRPQHLDDVYAALGTIRRLDFPILNVDLIYGGAEQTARSWLHSLREAQRFNPEELYLYPLYVRPGTGLFRSEVSATNHRRDLYRRGRDFLLSRGYEQSSLRSFRRRANMFPSTYACQRDGMIGLGCGGRSYTRKLHYATRFAVSQAGIRAILADWVAQADEDFARATHGVRLSTSEQRRRFLIMSLLQAEGLRLADYRSQFNSSPDCDFDELVELRSRGWMDETSVEAMRLTEAGLENSDVVGPLLYSDKVRCRLRHFVKDSVSR